MAPRTSGRLVLAGLVSALGFAIAGHPGALARLVGGEAVVQVAGGIAGWLGLAWLGIATVDALATRAGGTAPPRLLRDLARVLLYPGAVLAILAFVFGQPVGGLLATSGVLVAVIGFALRGMIADVFSGIAINVEHPYRIGDWIELDDGVVGQVVEINWRATRLATRDHTSVVVPNGVVAASRVVNFSFPDRHYRAHLRVALPASVPVERGRGVLLAAVLGAPRVLADPCPEVQVDGFDERGVVYVVRYWVDDYAHDRPCRDAVATAIAAALEKSGVMPGFPRREVIVGRHAASGAVSLADQLAEWPLFADFTKREIDAVAAGAAEVRFHPGQFLFRQGDPGGSLFLLGEGVLEVRTATETGELTIDRMLPGQVFGEISLLTGEARSASVVAVTEGIAYELDKSRFEPILRARPALTEALAELMARRRGHNREILAGRREGANAPADAGDLLRRLRDFFGV